MSASNAEAEVDKFIRPFLEKARKWSGVLMYPQEELGPLKRLSIEILAYDICRTVFQNGGGNQLRSLIRALNAQPFEFQLSVLARMRQLHFFTAFDSESTPHDQTRFLTEYYIHGNEDISLWIRDHHVNELDKEVLQEEVCTCKSSRQYDRNIAAGKILGCSWADEFEYDAEDRESVDNPKCLTDRWEDRWEDAADIQSSPRSDIQEEAESE